MTDEEILKKVIEKAIRNGYSFKDVFQKDRFEALKKELQQNKQGFSEAYGYAEDYSFEMGIIFSHDFAKAFWGGTRYKDLGAATKDGSIHGIEISEPWKFHLQKMVLEENPLKYLEQFI